MSWTDEEVVNVVRTTSAAWAEVRYVRMQDVLVAVEPWTVVGAELREKSPGLAWKRRLGRIDRRRWAAQDCVVVGANEGADDRRVDVLQGGLDTAPSCVKNVPSAGDMSCEEIWFHATTRRWAVDEVEAGVRWKMSLDGELDGK